jgi:hypothetical protein
VAGLVCPEVPEAPDLTNLPELLGTQELAELS